MSRNEETPSEEQPSWDHPDPFVIEVTATAEDVDSYGHVNNAIYLRWLERCAWAHSEAVGLPESRCLALRRGMAVIRIRLDYLSAAFAGDRLRVGNWILAGDGRLRVTRRFQLRGFVRGNTLLRGEIDYVCLNLDTGRPSRLPPEFRAGYAPTLARGATT